MAVEETIIRILELPEGRDCEWIADANVVLVSSRLDCEARVRALEDLQKRWRRQHLRLTGTA